VTGRSDVVIAGAGTLGSAIAWALTQRGVTDVCVVDVDLAHERAPLLHARPVRARWDHEANVRAVLATLEFYAAHATQVGFRPHGHLWLFDRKEALEEAGVASARRAALGAATQHWSAAEVVKRFPVLDGVTDSVHGAEFAPDDGLVDPCAVRALFREEARKAGARFLDGRFVLGLATTQREPGRRRLERVDLLELDASQGSPRAKAIRHLLTSHSLPEGVEAGRDSIRPGIVIDALGPWSAPFSAKLGALPLACPRRRQLALLSVPGRGADRPGVEWPALVADDAGAFFHPDSAYVVAGVDSRAEARGFELAYDGEQVFENAIWPHLAQRASCFERVQHLRGVSLLDSVTSDGSGVLGWLPGFSNVLEVHSFPGSGLMHAFAVARGLAELIVDGRFETLEMSTFAPTRFASPSASVTEKTRI